MKIFYLVAVLLLQSLELFANDAAFFEELNSQTEALAAQFKTQDLRAIFTRMHDWIILQPHLSAPQQEALTQIFSKLGSVLSTQGPTDQQTIYEALSILKENQSRSNEPISKEPKREIEQLLKRRLINTWLGCQPKVVRDISRSYLTLSEVLQLQALSKNSQENVATQVLKDFPDAILPFSETPPSKLSSLPGYSTIAQFKEAFLPLKAIRLAVRHVRSGRLDTDREKLLPELARMASALHPQTLGYRFISSLRESVQKNRTYRDRSVFRQYELLADAGHPYAIEIYSLLLLYQGKLLGKDHLPLMEKYLIKQPSTPGLTVQAKEDLRTLAPTAQKLLEILKNEQTRDRLVADLQVTQYSEEEKAQKENKIWEEVEKIANNDWATAVDKRQAFTWAYNTQHYSQASHWAEIIVQHPESTLFDIRNASAAATEDRNFKLASHWADIVAGHSEATARDKRVAYYCALQNNDTKRASYWSNLAAEDSEATLKDLRNAAIAAQNDRRYSLATKWADLAASDPQATFEDKRNAYRAAQFARNGQLTSHWANLVAQDPQATLTDKRNAVTAAAINSEFKIASVWLNQIARDPLATFQDKQRAYEDAVTNKDGALIVHWADTLARDPQATLVNKRNAAIAASITKNPELALEWAENSARDPEATYLDKRAALQAAYEGFRHCRDVLMRTSQIVSEVAARHREQVQMHLNRFSEKVSYWAEIVALSPDSTIAIWRSVARMFSEIGNTEKALQWLKFSAISREATDADRSAYSDYLAKENTSRVGQKRKRSENE